MFLHILSHENIFSLTLAHFSLCFLCKQWETFLIFFSCCVQEQSIFPYLMLLLLIIETEAPPFSIRAKKKHKFFVCQFSYRGFCFDHDVVYRVL